MRKARSVVRAVGVAALILGATVLIGCDKKDEGTKPAAGGEPASAAAAATAVTGKGVIRGHVKFSGMAPVLKPVERDCHPGGPKMVIPDESVLVSPAGELKNVIVFLKNPPAAGAAQPAPIIDQKDCVYVPHVVAMQTGQDLKFTSSDPILHNVHVVSMDNGEYNQSIAKGDTKSYPVKAAGFFKAKCDVHPWMVCSVGAFDHPYFAVTKDDGSFEFHDLPLGRYTLGFWQEKLGQRTLADVAVADDKPADVTFTYEPKKP
jgi:plastocyanin